MIKFFRKIRFDLLEKNKTGKYLKYAIGEIILVVIGILIALSINNWNENRKQKLTEINILNGIKNDILKDSIDINHNIKSFKTLIENDSIIIDHLVNNKKSNPQINSRLLTNFSYGELVIILHHSYFDKAKQKGLSIISNSTLRDSISRLYEFHYKLLEQVEQETEMFKVYDKIISDKLVGAFEINDKGNLSLNDEFYDKLLLDDNFTYLLNMHKNSTNVKYKAFYNPVLKSALTIVDAIDIELMKLKK